MLKKLFLFCLLCVSAVAMDLPDEFTVSERWLSFSTTFDIESKTEKLGCVWRKMFRLTPEYHLQNNAGELVAKGRMRIFSLLPYFDITDADGISIGTVEQRFTWFYNTFDFVSPSGHKMAQGVLNFWGTRYDINDPIDGHLLATLSRPFIRLKNNWTVNVIDRDALISRGLHPHMFLLVMAYQVDREYWEAAAAASSAEAERRNQERHSNAAPLKPQFVAFPTNPSVHSMLTKQLMYYSALEAIQPTAEDYTFIETLLDNVIMEPDEDLFAHLAIELMLLIDSDQLTTGQKGALYQMLKSRLG